MSEVVGAKSERKSGDGGGGSGRGGVGGAGALRDGLLCERCGYDLEGTPAGGVCAECGLAVGMSLGERRPGSPFQASPGFLTYLVTVGAAWVGPRGDRERPRAGGWRERGLWGVVAVESERSIVFAGVTLLLVPVVFWAGMVVTDAGVGFLNPAAGFGLVVNGAFFLAFLTVVESLGIQFFGRRRGWRITPDVAAAVVCHASPGWLTAGVLSAVGWMVGQALDQSNWVDLPGAFPGFLSTPSFMLANGGFLVGLLHFEVLVWLGVRNMRYANGGGGG